MIQVLAADQNGGGGELIILEVCGLVHHLEYGGGHGWIILFYFTLLSF